MHATSARSPIELILREQSATALPLVRINFVGPDTMTGTDVVTVAVVLFLGIQALRGDFAQT